MDLERIKERVLKMRCEDQKRQQVEQKFDEDEDPFQRYYASVPSLSMLFKHQISFTHSPLFRIKFLI